MKPKSTVISLPIINFEKTLEFYKNILGVTIESASDNIIAIELPNLSLFLIEKNEFEKYSSVSKVSALESSDKVETIISCAFSNMQEIRDIKNRLVNSGHEFIENVENNDTNFIGYFRDLDGHLWELVWNESTASK